ncbi:DUF4097 family beta strand repeat-containing protein [Streptomyces monticola]|uniref:DUF4097 family beta strand repeat-containing protein n=1 Tax=Streptomyces monticola TaxID=2666263 RepID=A0ABW2JRH1_9ACTN
MTARTATPARRPVSRPVPRTRRRRALIAVGGVVALTVFVGGCGASAGEDDDPEQRSFALQGRTLTVDSDDSALDVVAADVDRVRVTRWFKGQTVLGEDPEVTWSMSGDDTLRLRVRCDGFVSDCAARHKIEVPRDVAVRVSTEDGRVTASGFRTALKIHSDDGRVTVEDTSGPLDLGSKDGAVEARGVASKEIEARSDDGRVRLGLTSVPDRVEAVSRDGSVLIDLPDASAGYKVTADSNDGSVDVGVPRDEHSANAVTAHSDDGSVRVRSAGS